MLAFCPFSQQSCCRGLMIFSWKKYIILVNIEGMLYIIHWITFWALAQFLTLRLLSLQFMTWIHVWTCKIFLYPVSNYLPKLFRVLIVIGLFSSLNYAALSWILCRKVAGHKALSSQSPYNQNAISELTAGLCLSCMAQHLSLGMETHYTDLDASLILLVPACYINSVPFLVMKVWQSSFVSRKKLTIFTCSCNFISSLGFVVFMYWIRTRTPPSWNCTL